MTFRTGELKPEVAHNMGYTKKHLGLWVYAVGSWRMLGIYTEKQVQSGVWKPEVERKLKINGGGFDGHWTRE